MDAGRSGKALLGRTLASVLCLLVSVGEKAFADGDTRPISWPSGFDFTSSILSEGYSPDVFSRSYLNQMDQPENQDPYGLALANLTVGLVTKDASFVDKARVLFIACWQRPTNPKQRELSELAVNYTQAILSGRYEEGRPIQDPVDTITVRKRPPPATGYRRIVLGCSTIRVKKGAKVKTQVDRVIRDWLLATNITRSPWVFAPETLVSWHEGKKIRELMDFAAVQVLPVTGTLVRRRGWDWYAPNAEGVFAFKIAEDKVLAFPTTILVDSATAVIHDTHGISAIAWDCLDADLVVGCGDALGKMDAAYYLAEKGVDVYCPTDRFLGVLIGADTKGMVMGSAPVKKTDDGAVIGDQPVAFDPSEPIVVSDTDGRYPLQYYDTPCRYFRELERYLGKPMNIIPVDVREYGKAGVVVEEARKAGAKLIGIRIKSGSEHDALAAWLAEDRSHRAILFHTAVYPDGYRLFYEFPRQTSFGDIRPAFE
ncbi:MAG: hypothetical protein V2A58_13020 [Planctomycetota bacterium]